MKSKSITRYSPILSNRNLMQKQTLRFLINTICLLLIITLMQKNAIAQTLGINTTGAIPDSSAMLDIISADKGLLIPRIHLISTTDTTTISNPATSLLVYNTNDTITGGAGLGYYYFNGSMWMNFLSGTDNSITTPLITGGSGTTSSLTYKPTTGIGTTGADHVFQVGNNGATEAMRILNSGNVGIGTTAPGTILDVKGTGTGHITMGQYSSSSSYSGISMAGGAITPSNYNLLSSPTNTSLFINRPSGKDIWFRENDVNQMVLLTGGNIGIGLTSPSAKLHTLSTTEQLRLGYDASNYYSTTVGSTGAVTFDATGSGAAFTFSDAVTLPTGSIGVTQSLDDSTTQLATTAFVDRAVAGASGGSGWGLTGTSGTTDGTNFIGTTDNIPFNIKVNNQKAGRIDNTLANAFWGYQAGNANTTGYYNTAIGYQAFYSNTSGEGNTAMGNLAMLSTSTGAYNTATGNKAMYYNSTGTYNTAMGNQAMLSSTTGAYNVAIGADAMFRYGMGANNIAIGYQSMYGSATLANNTGSDNVAIGYQSLVNLSTGAYNIALGNTALASTTTGNWNIGMGYHSQYFNTTGSYNVSIGHSSINNNTTGTENTALGFQALRSNSTGSYSVAIGVNALYSSTAGLNTAIGYRASESITTGTYNTLVGSYAGAALTTGNYNTYVGDHANGGSAVLYNSTALGAYATVSDSNKVRIGNTNVTVIEGQVAWTSISDGRFKKNISETDVKGLPFIMQLRPVVYNIDTRQLEEFLTKNMPDSVRQKHFVGRNFTASTAIRHSGFVAQEVEVAAQATNYDFDGLHKPQNADDNYGLAYAEFVVPLVKAVQEQQQELIAKESVLTSLQNQINSKDILLTSLQNQIDQLSEVIQQIQNPKKQN